MVREIDDNGKQTSCPFFCKNGQGRLGGDAESLVAGPYDKAPEVFPARLSNVTMRLT